jgi:hypothetical protein
MTAGLTAPAVSVPSRAGRAWPGPLAAAGSVLAFALGLAFALQWIQQALGQNPETAVAASGVLCAAVLAAVPGVYLLRAGRGARPATAGLAALGACTSVLLGIYFFWVSAYVLFPADFLIWTESDFINDILKFSVGYPLYSPQVNNDSFVYVPGTQLLTYLLAKLAGKEGSIPAYRVIQLVYAAAAAFVGALCCHRILRIAHPEWRSRNAWLWNCLWFAGLLLIATNGITNPFTHNLHGDALALLTAAAAYYLLLKYGDTPKPAFLVAMTVFMPVGFLIRQSLVVWAGWFALFVLWRDRSWKRFAVFALACGGLVGITVGLCYAVWGEPFFYWIFTVLSKHGVSPLRSFQHLLQAWPYFAAGLLGGVVILQGSNFRVLLGAWAVFFGILITETYTSGIAWMLNHMGPGCLLAGIWFFAGLASMWNSIAASQASTPVQSWIRIAAAAAVVALLFNGMGLVRIPLRPIPDDAYRYVHEIERAFEGHSTERVLLDAGTWVYRRDKVIMRDRCPSIGERGFTGTGDFSALLSRIAARHYSRILVRGFHAPDFVYDYYLWPKSSGIRQALTANYRETGRIRAAEAPAHLKNWAEDPYYFGEITILEPKDGPRGL